MTIQQHTYLGASIRSVNANMGWNSNSSQISIELVEDPLNSDNFLEPSIGGPTFFEYYGINLGGLITGFRRTANTGGDPTYSVTIEDPRNILDGVQLITDGYTGQIFNTPNLYNIFGYWESFAFGNSLVNSTGIPWKRIRDGLVTLVNTTPIRFGTTNYYLNLSALPSVPDYFRISGPNLSVMDFISQVCEAASHEFFFNLESVGNNYYIRLYTVNRSAQPQLNRISTFINSQSEVTSTSTGKQLRNEVSSRFLVGGNVHTLYFQYPSGESVLTRDDDVIWPFWGLDEEHNVIIGGNNKPETSKIDIFTGQELSTPPVSGEIVKYFGNDHGFTIPTKGVNVVGVGDFYKTNVAEMRAALGGQDAWMIYLDSQTTKTLSPHYLKSAAISIIPDVHFERLGLIAPPDVPSITPVEFAYLTGGVMSKKADSLNEIHEENISRLYEYVKSYATEYYGRKFMVRLPNISSKFNPDWEGTLVDAITHNVEPVDGGFLEDVLWSGAILNNYLPQNTLPLLLDDNRISAYVRFNDFRPLDLSELAPEDFTINTDNNSVFIKCTLDPEIYFLRYNDLYSPRVVINLPAAVSLYQKGTGKSFDGVGKEAKRARMDGDDPAADEAALRKMGGRFGADLPTAAWAGQAEIPDMAVCPLKSNVDFYGPWYAIGVNAKTDFQKDESLVPWNYGGFAQMNLAASAQISSALSNFQIGEEGTLEIAGVPAFGLGEQLISGGPYITDINVSFSQGGVTTTYTMNTWGVRNTGVQKQLSDRVQKMTIAGQKAQRENRELTRRSSGGRARAVFDKRRGERVVTPPRARSARSTSQIIASESIQMSGGLYKANTVTMPAYYLAGQIGADFETKAAGSLDTLFRPFTTDPEGSGLPHFEAYSGTDPINVNSLNPFQSGNDFLLVSRDFPGDDVEMNDAEGYQKGVALRGPLVMTGWGRTTDGKPVPSSGDVEDGGSKEVFAEDYMKRMDLWKTGPVDIRWDDTLKIWKATGGGIIHGKLMSNISPGSSGLFRHYAVTTSGEHWNGTEEYVYDWLLKTGQSIITQPSGLNAFVGIDSNTGSKYILETTCV